VGEGDHAAALAFQFPIRPALGVGRIEGGIALGELGGDVANLRPLPPQNSSGKAVTMDISWSCDD